MQQIKIKNFLPVLFFIKICTRNICFFFHLPKQLDSMTSKKLKDHVIVFLGFFLGSNPKKKFLKKCKHPHLTLLVCQVERIMDTKNQEEGMEILFFLPCCQFTHYLSVTDQVKLLFSTVVLSFWNNNPGLRGVKWGATSFPHSKFLYIFTLMYKPKVSHCLPTMCKAYVTYSFLIYN